MPHNYFDIETTGLDPKKDEIITIQFQKIAIEDGKPEEPLTILKNWEKDSSERVIVSQIAPLLMSTNPFNFVPVGNNLDFEFRFLATKIKNYFGINLGSEYFHSRPYIDLKPLMILLNGGRFKGYHLILNKSHEGYNVPIWYQSKEYDKIIEYVKNEALAFTSFYTNVHNLMFDNNLRQMIFNHNGRIDDFV